jgi:hypothetical protein
MKRSLFLTFVAVAVVAAVPALAAGPAATKAVTGEEDGISTLAITVSSGSDEVYAVVISGARVDDVRAPKGWVGVASGNHVVFQTGANPVKSGNALAFKILTAEPSAAIKVSFRGKDDPIGKPMDL